MLENEVEQRPCYHIEAGEDPLHLYLGLSLSWVGNARGFRSVAATVTANAKVIRQLSSPPIDKTIITDRLRQSEWMIDRIDVSAYEVYSRIVMLSNNPVCTMFLCSW